MAKEQAGGDETGDCEHVGVTKHMDSEFIVTSRRERDTIHLMDHTIPSVRFQIARIYSHQ